MRVGHRRLRPDRPQAGRGARRRRRAGRLPRRRARGGADAGSAPARATSLDALLALRARRGRRRHHPRPARRARRSRRSRRARTCSSRSPRGSARAQVEARRARPPSARAGCVKVGFNHRFHPGIARAVAEARSGAHGEILHLRARYGHGGRLGYEREWRADPARSGGGELIDQGMHLLDLSHWLLGPLPLHSALLRTAFWDMPVEDNAVVAARRAPRRARGRCCTCPGRSGRTCSRSRSTAARPSCRSTASCAPTARSG